MITSGCGRLANFADQRCGIQSTYPRGGSLFLLFDPSHPINLRAILPLGLATLTPVLLARKSTASRWPVGRCAAELGRPRAIFLNCDVRSQGQSQQNGDETIKPSLLLWAAPPPRRIPRIPAKNMGSESRHGSARETQPNPCPWRAKAHALGGACIQDHGDYPLHCTHLQPCKLWYYLN